MSAKKKNSLNRQVRRAYRQDELARILTLPEDQFGPAFGMTTTVTPQKRFSWHGKYSQGNDAGDSYDFYHFRDNGSRVLAVAHLDTVVRPERRIPHFRQTASGPYVRCGSLDDRLGAYVILRLLPRLSVTCDWLLTTGEESCASTAAFFEPAKDYDHVIEFDRMGTDVVMYQFDDEATRKLVRASGATVGHGSFSDIAVLEELGVKAFNWGVGYRGNYHSENGYAYLYDTFGMVAKYLRFHAQNAGMTLPHEPEDRYYSSRYRADDDKVKCVMCGRWAVDWQTGFCEACDCCEDCLETAADCQCYKTHEFSGKPVGQLTAGSTEDEDDGSTAMTLAEWELKRDKYKNDSAAYLEWLRKHANGGNYDDDPGDGSVLAEIVEDTDSAADEDDAVSILAQKLG